MGWRTGKRRARRCRVSLHQGRLRSQRRGCGQKQLQLKTQSHGELPCWPLSGKGLSQGRRGIHRSMWSADVHSRWNSGSVVAMPGPRFGWHAVN